MDYKEHIKAKLIQNERHMTFISNKQLLVVVTE